MHRKLIVVTKFNKHCEVRG